MKFPGISVGLSHTVRHTVDHSDTVGNFLPDEIQPLLSSSGMVALVVQASVALIDHRLPDGFLTIGKSSEVVHEHPSVVGAHLVLSVTIQEFDGYHIALRFVASDESGVVASGTHMRSIVNQHWLQVRIAQKIHP